MIEVREEAYLWTMEESGVSAKVTKSKSKASSHLAADAQCTTVKAGEKSVSRGYDENCYRARESNQ